MAGGAHQPLLIGFREHSNGVREITKFLRWAKANNVTVFATWPNTLYFKEYNAHPAFAEIVNFYRAAGVEIIGRPQDAMVSSAYLADTIYHLTAAGIAERTRKLVENLKSDRAFVEWLENARPAAK